MTKQGFLNLPDAEKEPIVEAAMDEFAKQDFFSASLNRIIQNAGISKGSMYHYFHNKEDLYLYILGVIGEKKKEFMAKGLAGLNKPLHQMSFFQSFEVRFKLGVSFALDNPRYQLIGENLERIKDSALYSKFMAGMGVELENYMRAMVDQAIASGELRDDLDRDFIARVFKFVMINFRQIFPESTGQDGIDRDRIYRDMEQLVAFLKNGLQDLKWL
ncbi:MAG: TetR/AcrR family transcriptional regulator [Eubacteriales bacterium]|nr:TetR/AcrR family transcriptional regulator [Bacillota bacterium]MBV1726807.1 TetR/AcrR family transcriptional regulator [Desulforudis sp.]MDP3051360.1 TetR/AcrR family transcriptional regulator [Eubacteriales bacterium]MBV1735794.1 TetR/AcrR family transcriptional regulator [Desulforudis sp.]MDZ4043019.1 TetR/AcrR family transcriptional regulator [Eubacteriales bacterium]